MEIMRRTGKGKPPTCEERVQAVLTRTLEPWSHRPPGPRTGPAGACPGAVRRCKDPDASPATHPTQLAPAAGTPRHAHARLHRAWHHHALHVQTGQVTAQTQARHHQQEFLAFLDHLAADSPADTPVHVILDPYAMPKTADVHTWLDAHPDWHFHFIPTSSSWMNAVEGFFATWVRGCLQRGNFASLQDLVDTMHRYLEAHNRPSACPFRWRKDPEEIMAAGKRGYHKLETMH